MLKLTKKADYGLIAMKHLAEHATKGALSAKELAENYGIPPEALAKILQKLVRAKLLLSQHGINGGYVLAKDPRQITAFEVIRAIDGQLFITTCLTSDCDQSDRCTVREPLRMVNESIREVLSRISIADMARDAERQRHALEREPAVSAAELVTLG
jgi:Rrf2 family protein